MNVINLLTLYTREVTLARVQRVNYINNIYLTLFLHSNIIISDFIYIYIYRPILARLFGLNDILVALP